MTDLAEHLEGWLLPGILIAFLALYVLGIRTGLEPEMAMLQAGGVGLSLAIIGRLAVAVVTVEPPSTEPIDLTASAISFESEPDDSDDAVLFSGEESEAFGGIPDQDADRESDTELGEQAAQQQAVGV